MKRAETPKAAARALRHCSLVAEGLARCGKCIYKEHEKCYQDLMRDAADLLMAGTTLRKDDSHGK